MIPRYLIDPAFSTKIHPYSDCIIIGSGIAGLSTAIWLSEYNIKVLTKSSPSTSTTWYAQGGIAAAIKKPDWWKKHYEDTIIAGQGLSDKKAVEILVKNAPAMIEKLVEIGTKFDITEGEVSLTTEGGHSHARVLHAGGDATGEEIEKKLVAFAKGLRKLDFNPDYFVLDVITSGDRCLGVIGLDLEKKTVEIHPSSNVLVATGGVGQIFELSTNPSISTGDGIALAQRAGAEIMDIEFVQFHPTVFKTNSGDLFLISEALRGEGAYLRDSKATASW
jgi:L-aspartate oxidase